MLRVKGGLNDFEVSVVKGWAYDDKNQKCEWLGHQRFRCGHCRKGYFNVYTESRHDEVCPECSYRVVVRWAGD